MAYRLEIRREAQKQILSFPRKAQVEVAAAIDRLKINPRPTGYRKLRGKDLWRIRIGRYRVVYDIDDDARLLTVVKIAPRREDTYQGL